MARICPVCGAKDGACGDAGPLAFAPILAPTKGALSVAGKGDKGPILYMPKQQTRRGKAGYKGDRVVIIGSKQDKRPKGKVIATEDDD